jgi:hypothetical protein
VGGKGTFPTGPRQQTVRSFQPISFRQAELHLFDHAFQGLAVGAPKVEMMFGQDMPPTIPTYRKVLFAIPAHHLVGDAILAKTVEDTINGRPVDDRFNLPGNGFVAEGFGRV